MHMHHACMHEWWSLLACCSLQCPAHLDVLYTKKCQIICIPQIKGMDMHHIIIPQAKLYQIICIKLHDNLVQLGHNLIRPAKHNVIGRKYNYKSETCKNGERGIDESQLAIIVLKR